MGSQDLENQQPDPTENESPKENSVNPLKFLNRKDDSGLVSWNGPNDPAKPMNWSIWRKYLAVLSICSLALVTSFSSSVYAPAASLILQEFHVSETVANLGVSLYVLGFAAGPLLWGPLSEVYGRTRPLFTALSLFTIFQIPFAVAKNIATILVARFISGAAGSAAFAIPPAIAVDFLTPAQRLFAVNFYMTFTFIGPVAGPLVGTVLTIDHGWRWTGWVSLIMGGACGVSAFLVIPESCEGTLLQRKALKLRKDTGEENFLAKRDWEPVTGKILLNNHFTKPLRMLRAEPILLLVTIYSSLVYGLLYLLLFSLPYSFSSQRGWSAKKASLVFLGVLLGVLMGCMTTMITDMTWWLKRFIGRGRKVCPEDRLPQLMVSAVLLPIGLIWSAWTSNRSVPWPAQVVSTVLIGSGIVLNILSTTAYLIEVYLLNSNSAVSAYVCIRPATAVAFPLFAIQSFEHLGVDWAATVLAIVCALLGPVPFLFWIYGEKIRGWSKYSF